MRRFVEGVIIRVIGWAKSMLNRIALNIRVEVRNMVFKFRTETYVSSVSWQSLTFDPCDPSWRAAMSLVEE
ncbi:hypothetical protein T484DRAFT_1846884 [Baffinella frigidus]|nr:hypothetical protein T484DRAFT_1846884 [Cryptophyta sp. CCMP2293]